MSEVAPGLRLMAIDDLPDPGGKPVDLDDLPIVILRSGDAIRAYINVCPHAGRPLSLPSGKTLVKEGILVCPFHGASFEVTSGHCVGGPAGKSTLKPIAIEIRDRDIYTA